MVQLSPYTAKPSRFQYRMRLMIILSFPKTVKVEGKDTTMPCPDDATGGN